MTEVSLQWGADFQLSSTGDLLLVTDGPTGIPAETQRLVRLILTNPGDDIFHVNYGVGGGELVGEFASETNAALLEGRIRNALGQEPYVTDYNVDVYIYQNALTANISVTTIQGFNFALPALRITPSGT